MVSHRHGGNRFQLLAAVPVIWISAWVVQADVVLDGSMGPGGPLSGPDFSIEATHGTTVGSNLFHSFSEFNLSSAQSATFNGPASTNNVIGRVTSGSASNIDGQIRSTIPNANLFLVNPHGLIFGPNATLDVQGSFYASTADYIELADGQRFTAMPSAQDALLTTAAPAAFGFLGASPGSITVNDSFLEVPTGKTLAFIGGDVSVTGSSDGFAGNLLSGTPSDPVMLDAPGGRIDLVSVAASGEVPLQPDNPGTDGFSDYGRIELRDTVVAVSADSSGAVYIRGGEIVIDSASVLSDTVDGDGGDITIKGNSVVMHNDAFQTASGEPKSGVQTGSTGNGRGGDIRVDAQDFTIDGDIQLFSVNQGLGQGGDIVLNVGSLGVHRTAYVHTETNGDGASGGITVNADSIRITNVPAANEETRRFTGIGTYTFGNGDGGELNVNAGSIEITSPRAEFFNWGQTLGGGPNNTGNTGDMLVKADSIVLLAGGHIGNVSVFSGNAGNVTIEADSIFMDWQNVPVEFGTGTFIGTISVFGGDAGNLEINTGSLDVIGSKITAHTDGGGSSGNISIVADSIFLDGDGNDIEPEDSTCTCAGTYISATSYKDNGGASGIVDIDTGSLMLQGNATITSTTANVNPAGAINIDATSILLETNSRIDTRTFGAGDGGSINLSAENITLASGGSIIASSTDSGAAGDITINVTDRFESVGGFISTEAVLSDGGNITLNATHLLHLVDSSIATNVQGGAGAGGNISIDPEFVILNNSRITANAFGGPGGNISIVAENFFASPDSVIEASSALSVPGSVEIDSPNINTVGDINAQPESYLDAGSLLPERCAARDKVGRSSFVVAGRGGLPPDPDGYLASYYGARLPVQQSSTASDEQLAALFESWRQDTQQALSLLAESCQS